MSSAPRRAFPPLILIVAPGALAAQATTTEEAIEAHRAEIAEVVSQVCPAGANPDDPNNVVVCGRRERFPRYRVPSADPALAMRPGNKAGGEQLAALAAGECLRLCHQPVMVNVIGIGGGGVSGAIPAIVGGIDRLLHPD